MREQLTEGDVKKIQEEIEYRKLVVRKEAIEAVKEARAHGDLSENFEYHAAKKDQKYQREPDPLSGAYAEDSKRDHRPLEGRRSRAG